MVFKCHSIADMNEISIIKHEKKQKTEERKFDRKVREALEIQLQQTSPHSDHGLNQDDGQYVTTSFWKPMLAHIRGKTLQ